MADIKQVQHKVSQTLDLAANISAEETDTRYQQLQTSMFELAALAREAYQAQLNEACQPLLAKLEDDEPLSRSEQETLELLLIGDAKTYLERAGNLEDWRREIQRLLEEISRLQGGLHQVDTLMCLQAYCREAMRILPDLVFYFQEQERVKRFEAVRTENLDRAQRQILIDLIKAMMDSDKL